MGSPVPLTGRPFDLSRLALVFLKSRDLGSGSELLFDVERSKAVCVQLVRFKFRYVELELGVVQYREVTPQ